MEHVSPISFLTAIVATNEILIGHIYNIYVVLKQILKEYATAEIWNASKDTIYSITRYYPYLDVSSRTHAQKELKRWSELFETLTNIQPHRFRNEFF